MPDLNLIYPMLAMVLLTFGVAVALFRARLRSIREGHTPKTYFRTFQGAAEPEYLIKSTRHFVNLFEVPTLFYAGCLAALVAGVTGPLMQALAWGYVATRVMHAIVHIGGNRLRKRMTAYFLSWLFLLAFWISLGVDVATRH
ncbi:MAG: MAPEG family protein [Pseudomonadota bacterium]